MDISEPEDAFPEVFLKSSMTRHVLSCSLGCEGEALSRSKWGRYGESFKPHFSIGKERSSPDMKHKKLHPPDRVRGTIMFIGTILTQSERK